LNKEKRKLRGLTPEARDILIRWWNVNQRLVDKEDPVCATLAEQINSLTHREPLSPLQIAGYFSHLCRAGLKTEDIRTEIFNKSLYRGDHTIMPKYTQPLIDAIEENWLRERALEEAKAEDDRKLLEFRKQGINKKVIANV